MEMIQLILQLILQNNLKFALCAITPRMIVLTFDPNMMRVICSLQRISPENLF